MTVVQLGVMADQDRNWVSLREAADRSGASMSALRKWVREETVTSKQVRGKFGPEYAVDLDEVQAHYGEWKQVIEKAKKRPVRVDAHGSLSMSVEGLQATVDALTAALSAVTGMVNRLDEAERARDAALRVLSQLVGSEYGASELVKSER